MLKLGALAAVSYTHLDVYKRQLWVSDPSKNTVVEISPNDGTLLKSVLSVGRGESIAYDGTNLWVADGSLSYIAKLNGATGRIMGTYSLHGPPPHAGPN